ncbi:unnamed protein product [Paramecium sonneborni]|uniref:VWFA domain-containing protein n=1 Tax=Paramecium sonneborni TaxID=65129 RepID=A0A8S1RFV2_9CILI|nr:unnamed protein product [Paramecium sonneborni]
MIPEEKIETIQMPSLITSFSKRKQNMSQSISQSNILLQSSSQCCEKQEQIIENIQLNEKKNVKKVEEDKKQQILDYNLNTQLSLEIKSIVNTVVISNTQQQYLQGMVSLKALDIMQNINEQSSRVGVDLFCLIDRSGSMHGDKLTMVKKTLVQLLEFLGDKDRLQLIVFNGQAQRITPLNYATTENKLYFKEKIASIKSGGDTKIANAFQLALDELKQRQVINDVSSIFLLSDGQDSTAFVEIQNSVSEVKDVFSIHCFGFGRDNDTNMMTSICNLKNGSFYFVQEIDLLDEFFADAFGGLITVIGEQLEIKVSIQSTSPFENVSISKTYGKMWQKIDKDYIIKLPHIVSGTRKDFVFELCWPTCQNIDEKEIELKVLDVSMTLKNPITKQVIQKDASLIVKIVNSDNSIIQNEQDLDVLTQYYRVKGTETILNAKQLCDQDDFDQAKLLIQSMLIKIKPNEFILALCQGIVQDLEQALQACERNRFQNYGNSQMIQFVSNNFQQIGSNSIFNSRGQQLSSTQASYSNTMQSLLRSQVQDFRISQQSDIL